MKSVDYLLGEEYRYKYELYVDTHRHKLVNSLVDLLYDYSIPENWEPMLRVVIDTLVTNSHPGELTIPMNELELVKDYERWVEDYLSE